MTLLAFDSREFAAFGELWFWRWQARYAEHVASIVIRQLNDATIERLRVRASRHGRCMEEEAREILNDALTSKDTTGRNLAESIRRRLAPLGGIELPNLPRERMR
jgi:antitoxin FitA